MKTRTLLYLGARAAVAKPIQAIVGKGWDIYTATDLQQVQALNREHSFHIGIVEFPASDNDEFYEWLPRLCRLEANIQWVALLPPQCLTQKNIRELLLSCFYDFHTLPVQSEDLLVTLGQANGMLDVARKVIELRRAPAARLEMLGTSELMKGVARNLRKFAKVQAPVLLTGESGTGKELAARIIHEGSVRAHEPFVAVNCAALQPTLIQSELFGHERGAFTGALQRKTGHIEAAAGGTILLDEIGDLPLDLQVNLLRFLEEGCVERVGSVSCLHVDARVVAATNVDLEQLVREGRFREDLYYRLNVLHQELPPLRSRAEDTKLLAMGFLEEFRAESDTAVKGFTAEALCAIQRYEWPGNIRELINRIRRAVVMCDNRLIGPRDLGLEQRANRAWLPTLREVRADAEKRAILASLRCNSENVSEAARQLGISRARLYELMQAHHVPR